MSPLKVESKRPNLQIAQPRLWSNTITGLWAAVFFSVTLHLLVLYVWLDNKDDHISIGQHQFSVLIVSPDTSVTHKRKPSIHKVEKPVVRPRTKKVAATEKQTPQAATETLQQQTQQSKNAVRGKIQSRLSQYLSYPEFARRKGWQGIVVISLSLNESGQFKDIQVNASSGFDILDNTAVEAMHKLNAIEVKQEFKLAFNTILEIPIHFKLQGS